MELNRPVRKGGGGGALDSKSKTYKKSLVSHWPRFQQKDAIWHIFSETWTALNKSPDYFIAVTPSNPLLKLPFKLCFWFEEKSLVIYYLKCKIRYSLEYIFPHKHKLSTTGSNDSKHMVKWKQRTFCANGLKSQHLLTHLRYVMDMHCKKIA